MMPFLVVIAVALTLYSGIRAGAGVKVTVDCDLDQMSVHIPKTLIPGFQLADLLLLDPNCEPVKSENSSHMTVTTPLTDCGTEMQHTKENVIYRNVIEDGYARNAIVGRLQVLEIPFECVYLNQAEASLVQMNVEQTKAIALAPEEGSGMFALKIDIFKSEDYAEEYLSFPLVVTLQQRLYLQVSVDTPDTRLGITADTCYATPINSISKKEKHDIILNGCPTDETVKFYGAPATARRFSFTAFQFINGPVEPYLYVHCDVKLCNLTDSKPSCMKECNDKLESRQRREVNTDIYDLERGPIIILKEKEYSLGNDAENEEMGDKRDPSSSRITPWLLVVMGIMCAICFGAVIHTVMEVKRARKASDSKKDLLCSLSPPCSGE